MLTSTSCPDTTGFGNYFNCDLATELQKYSLNYEIVVPDVLTSVLFNGIMI